MRAAFAHDAVVDLPSDGDPAAPGAAITLALCGAVDHVPPCPLAPHHTAAERRADGVALRVLFVAEPAAEARVRALIDGALAAGWTVRSSTAGAVSEDEREHAARLDAS